MFKTPQIVSMIFVFLSAFAIDAIQSAWLSVYPVLGGSDITLPVPTDIALQLSDRFPLIVLTIFVLFLLIISLSPKKLPTIRNSITVSIGIVWFVYFLFITWALALPFIHIEPVI